jgi:hypothetical protein
MLPHVTLLLRCAQSGGKPISIAAISDVASAAQYIHTIIANNNHSKTTTQHNANNHKSANV